jgi:hypothetical protein
MSKTCPKSKISSSSREVIYGMPDRSLGETKYLTGGCCKSENIPMTICIHYDWEGDIKNNLKTLGSADLSI